MTVAEADIEFGYSDAANTDSINFTDNTITLTDAIFAGATITKATDSFFSGGVTFSHVGSTLSIDVPFGFAKQGAYSAPFRVVPVPEPSAFVALGSLAFVVARRRRARSS